MAVNALEGSAPVEKEAPIAPTVEKEAMPLPAPAVAPAPAAPVAATPKPATSPSHLPAAKAPAKGTSASQRLADLEAQIQQTDELIKETKTVSMEEIMGSETDKDKASKSKDKRPPSTSKLDSQNLQENEDNMKVQKQAAKKPGKVSQKSAKPPGKKENKNIKTKNQTKSTINAAKPANKLKNATRSKHQSVVQLSKKSKAKNYSKVSEKYDKVENWWQE